VKPDLSRADLIGAKLSKTDLSRANLSGAKLERVDLIAADMISTNLTDASITAASLWGTACDNWIIDGIKCDYIYLDEEGKESTPKDSDFRPSEFEELYKSLPTIDYYFEDGFTPIDAVIMDKVVQAINEKYPEYHLDIVSFDKRGTPYATITVADVKYLEQAKEEITTAQK
jgi:uncharacterized protein YjbI with pentapeptide repeats